MEVIKNAYKLSQAIQKHGVDFTASREGQNQFGCDSDASELILTGRGLFHTDSGFLNISLKESGLIRKKGQQKLLLLFTDKLRVKDIVAIRGQSFFITGIEDVGGLGFALDVSLEVIHV